MLAVAVHSVADCGNQGLLLLGLNRFALRVGQSADPALQQEIHRFLTAREEVAEALNLITLQNGADAVVTVKARMTENASAPVLVDAINRCERTVRAAFPQVRWLFFEPDVAQ
jgi:divalent metal cation (Fe/Co/Zn/Cd) transporter